MGDAEVEACALAVTELGTNLVRYAVGGELELELVYRDGCTGVAVCSRDSGPGIRDTVLALADGYSTGGGLGSGLGSVRRLMDSFELRSSTAGTVVETRKWRRRG